MGCLDGRIAIVTGAGTGGVGLGNGRAAAITFARAGATVIAVDHDDDALDGTVESIRAEGNRVVPCKADVADPGSCAEIVAIASSVGPPTILHNNVGVGGGESAIADVTSSVWSRVFAANVESVLWLAQACVPHMVSAGGGAIVNVSSVESVRMSDHASIAYQASKGALNSLTVSLARRLGRHGIRVNAVMPGFIDTPLAAAALARPGVREMLSSQVPLGRVGSPWEVANVALFLVSDAAAYVSGALVPVDGGFLTQF